jgi:hypothetical protein
MPIQMLILGPSSPRQQGKGVFIVEDTLVFGILVPFHWAY